MKNISKLLAFGFMGLALASCDDSYDDWSQPQQNPQEEIITLPNFTATVAQPIDFDQVTSDSVTVFTLNDATLPEGVTLEKGRLEMTAQNAAKTTVNVSGNGRACTAELLDAVVAAYGKRPVERTMSAEVLLNAMKDGQAALIKAGTIELKLTPKASEYTPIYYLVGALQGWSDQAKTCMFYPESQTVQTYTTQWTGDGNLKIWDENNFGDWNNCIGAATNGDNAASGKLVTSNAGAIVCPEKGAFYTLKVDFDAMSYTWVKLDNQTPTEYEKISLIGGFNNWDGDEMMTATAPHNWTAKVTFAADTELKFRANGDWGTSWGINMNVADTYYGTCTKNGVDNNIKVPAGTYNVFFNDITGEFVFAAE